MQAAGSAIAERQDLVAGAWLVPGERRDNDRLVIVAFAPSGGLFDRHDEVEFARRAADAVYEAGGLRFDDDDLAVSDSDGNELFFETGARVALKEHQKG